MQSAPEKEQKMKYDLIETGKRIKEIRKQNGLTQEQFAEMFNVSIVHLASVEKGRRGASIELLVDVACKFDMSLDYLILGKRAYDAEEAKAKVRNAIDALMNIEKQL